jgi:hypothetical protein
LLFAGIIIFPACKKEKTETIEQSPTLGTCVPVESRTGLVMSSPGYYAYESAGGATIKIQRVSTGILQVIMSFKAYPTFKYEFWGTGDVNQPVALSHENLNGKHLKDRLGNSRSVIFPDGTKATIVSTGPYKNSTAISIYDGAKATHLNLTCDKIEYSGNDQQITKLLDDNQADGETSTFVINSTGLIFSNIYDEVTPGNKIEMNLKLGELILANPTQVNDYYDDARLAAT